MLDTVAPSFLPLYKSDLMVFQKGFRVPEILREIFLGNEHIDLVEYFEHLVKRNRGRGCVLRRIPEQTTS
jgi:hypothetical protein